MRVKTLAGREVPWNLSGLEVARDDATPRSGLHLRARALLRSLYPMDRLLEEVPIPGTRLRADFYLPSVGLMIEVQGQQHFQHSARFHGSYDNFLASRKRDRLKGRFCEINDIVLVELRFDQTDEQWRAAILDA